MALDPTLSLQAGQGVTPLAQPMDIMGKGLALQGGMLQMQQQRMQNQQIQQQLQDAADLRATLQKAAQEGSDPEKAVEKLGSPLAAKYLGTMLDMRQKGVTLQKNQFDLASAHLQKLGNSILGAANTPGASPQGMASLIQQHAQAGDIPGPQAQEMLADLQNVRTPDDLKSWAQLQAVKSGVAKDVLGLFTPKTTIQGATAVTQNPLTGEVVGTKPVPGIGASDIGKLAADMGLSVNDPRVTAKYKELHPKMAMFMGPNAGGPNGPATPMGPGGAIAPDNPALKGLDSATSALVQKYARYELPMSPRFSADPRNRELMGRIMMLNPNFNEADSQTAYKFLKDLSSSSPTSAGGQVQAMNNAFEHLGSMAAIAPQMAGSNLPFFNKLSNIASKETGGTAPVQWDTAAHLLSAEVQKMIKGGMATEGETKQLLDNLSGSASLDQKKAVLGELAEFMYGKIRSFEARRASLLGAMDPGTSFLTPSAQKNLVSVFQMAGKPVPDDLLPAKPGASNTAKQGIPAQQEPPKVMSLADAKATAAASGKTLDQVIQAAKAKGWRIQ